MNGRCLSDAQLEQLRQGVTGRWQRWWWRRHLALCPYCQARQDEASDEDRWIAELRAALRPAQEAPPTSGPG